MYVTDTIIFSVQGNACVSFFLSKVQIWDLNPEISCIRKHPVFLVINSCFFSSIKNASLCNILIKGLLYRHYFFQIANGAFFFFPSFLFSKSFVTGMVVIGDVVMWWIERWWCVSLPIRSLLPNLCFTCRSSRPEVFLVKSVLKTCSKFIGKPEVDLKLLQHPRWSALW